MGDAMKAEDCVCTEARHQLIEDLANNDSFSGTYIEKVAGEAFSFGEPGYLKSDGKVWKADADAEATSGGLILMALGSISEDAAGNFALPGCIIRHDDWNWTVDAKLYIDTTPGDPTEIPPSGTGDVVRVIAHSLHADRLFFNPDSYYTVVP